MPLRYSNSASAQQARDTYERHQEFVTARTMLRYHGITFTTKFTRLAYIDNNTNRVCCPKDASFEVIAAIGMVNDYIDMKRTAAMKALKKAQERTVRVGARSVIKKTSPSRTKAAATYYQKHAEFVKARRRLSHVGIKSPFACPPDASDKVKADINIVLAHRAAMASNFVHIDGESLPPSHFGHTSSTGQWTPNKDT